MSDWAERAAGAIQRHDDGAARLPEDGDERQRQLTRMGNAAWAAGLSLLMAGRDEERASVAPSRRGALSRELAERSRGELGTADRGDEVATHRG